MKYFLVILFFHFASFFFGQAIKSGTFKRAEKAFYNDDFEKAKILYEKTIDQKGSCSQCFAQLANIYSNVSNYEEALKKINKALEIEKSAGNPNQSLGYYFSIRSFVFFNLGDLKRAKKDISEAIDLETDNDNYYFMRSLMRRMDGDLRGCCKDLEFAKELGNLKAQEYITIYCSK